MLSTCQLFPAGVYLGKVGQFPIECVAPQPSRQELAEAKRQAKKIAAQERLALVLEEAEQEKQRQADLAASLQRDADEQAQLQTQRDDARAAQVEQEADVQRLAEETERKAETQAAENFSYDLRQKALAQQLADAEKATALQQQQQAAQKASAPSTVDDKSKLQQQRNFLADARARAKARVDELTRKETGFRIRMSGSRPLPIPRVGQNAAVNAAPPKSSKPAPPPKPDGGDDRWQRVVERHRTKLQGLRKVPHYGVPINGLLQRVQADSAVFTVCVHCSPVRGVVRLVLRGVAPSLLYVWSVECGYGTRSELGSPADES